MPRHAVAVVPPPLELDRTAAHPLHRQIYERLRDAVISEQLSPGARLPSVLGLASHLGVARNTVADAYAQLQAEGYLVSKVGFGTTVTTGLPDHPLPNIDDQHAAIPQTPDLPAWQGVPVLGDPPPLRPGVPAIDVFPYEMWARLIAHHARHSLRAVAAYQAPAGYYPLRTAIAMHLAVARGVRCTPEQVIVTSGSQAALDLAARTLLRGGDHVWMEEPGNPGARGAFLGAGADLSPIPVDAEGLNVHVGVARDPRARLAYVTPAHQFPLGVAMSLARRLALLEWARRTGTWIVEEDYDSEYRFRGRPLAALQALDHTGRVIYAGTFSRILFPALRVGYLVSPPNLVDAFIAVRRYIDRHPPILEQLALADFLARGYLARHVRRMRTIYAARGNALVAAVAAECGGLLDLSMPESGLHAVGWLRPETDDRAVAHRANQAGIGVLPLSAFALAPLPHNGLLIGYGAVPEEQMRPVVRRLAQAIVPARAASLT
ncbi:MAG: MocR-like pyridoxine biosynthesis transcription factor PdxR [Dehalococcoidia bacterium]